MFYSPSENTCYVEEFRADYEANGTWPIDAVEITDEMYRVVVSNRPANKIMVPGPNGLPMLADPPPPTLAEVQTAALTAIDAAAGAARVRYITTADGQAATYLLKAADADRYKSAGYPAAQIAGYPWVRAKARAMVAIPAAADYQAAADLIISTRDAWAAKGADIEEARESGKRVVAAAIDVAAVDAARAVALARLMAL